MSEAVVHDGYEEAAAAKLWALLPEVYRNDDSAVLDVPGPLQELLSRIAVQVATVRRSLDRLWDDQSIETCDDWLVPYIGALLDVNLVAGLDGRGVGHGHVGRGVRDLRLHPAARGDIRDSVDQRRGRVGPVCRHVHLAELDEDALGSAQVEQEVVHERNSWTVDLHHLVPHAA